MTDVDLLGAVRDVASLAGAVAMSHFRASVSVEIKRDGSPVSEADRAAERAARDWIAQRFPRDGVLGEELGETNAGAKRRWIIDPIDGTVTFLRGVPLWGSLVGVMEGDDVLAGAICCPATSDIVFAARGQGCWWNDARAAVSNVARVADAMVLTTTDRIAISSERQAGWRALSSAARASRGWGDCYGYMLVATGRAEVMFDPALSLWDAAALLPVITEAGGVFTDWSGRTTPAGGSAIATNAAIATSVREILGAAPPLNP